MASGCGDAPTPRPSPTPASVPGEWLGEQQVTDEAGGEGAAPVFEDVWRLPSQFPASVTQVGSTLTAVMDIDRTGATCTYSGAIDANVITLTMTSCTDAKLRGIA